jgi:predicted SnoaL-like aldol condensation-catalyzing enzyme
MSYSISTLLIRNLHDVFGENDPARRLAAIDEIFTEDCVFYDPSKGVYRETVMVSLRFDRIEEFIEGAHYAQHASKIGDGIARLRERIASVAKEGGRLYLTPRRFVAEGNFVLVLSEGELPSGPTALYDLFRVENGKIVEHWDVLTPIPPRDQWKNSNGPF